MKKQLTLVLIALILLLNIGFANVALAATLPLQYKTELLLPAQAQLSTSVCWAFTHNEVISANVAKTTGVLYDFSEESAKFETARGATYGYNRSANEGGNEYMSTAYLARQGITLEKDEPFTTTETRTVNPAALTHYGYLKSTKFYNYPTYNNREQSAQKPQAIQKIKELVYQYGAVGSSMYFLSAETNPEYHSANRENYYYNGNAYYSNHSVTIVGWDDNYSKYKFAQTPEANGAFIVKNSWGNYHQNGSSCYVYVSYYDAIITSEFFTSEYSISNELFNNTYQYDYYGWSSDSSLKGNTALCVNRFNSNKINEQLTAVSYYVSQPGTTVEVYLCQNKDFKNKNSYIKLTTKQHDSMGYYLTEISPVKLTKGEYYIGINYISTDQSTKFPLQYNVDVVTGSETLPNTCYVSDSFESLKPLDDIPHLVRGGAMLPIKSFTRSLSDVTTIQQAFADVDTNLWYNDGINYCATRTIFSGVGNNMFAPDNAMTRAMFVKALANISGENLSGYTSPFYDTEAGSWYEAAVAWGYANGIVAGVSDTAFDPHAPVTREQMCALLFRFTNYMGIKLRNISPAKTFSDGASIEAYAKDAVNACTVGGVINGHANGSFTPKNSATRAEVAVMLTNLCKNYIY